MRAQQAPFQPFFLSLWPVDVDQQQEVRPIPRKPDRSRIRVAQHTLIYCIGLTSQLASEEVLRRREYIGQYGQVQKISVVRNGFTGKGQKGPSFSVYITFPNELETSLAILALNGLLLNDQCVMAGFGTTKYCTFFLKKMECPNLPHCCFLHCLDRDNEIDEIDREGRSTKEVFDSQQKLAEDIVHRNLKKVERMASLQANKTTVFPSVAHILTRLRKSREQAGQNPQITQQTKSMNHPERSKGSQEDRLNECIEQPEAVPFRKTQSVIVEPSSDTLLESYIHHKILKTCMKQQQCSSKLWFAQEETTPPREATDSCHLRKYMIQHLRRPHQE